MLAARAGSLSCLVVLLEVPGVLLDLVSEDGSTALHFCAAGHPKMVEALLSRRDVVFMLDAATVCYFDVFSC